MSDLFSYTDYAHAQISTLLTKQSITKQIKYRLIYMYFTATFSPILNALVKTQF